MVIMLVVIATPRIKTKDDYSADNIAMTTAITIITSIVAKSWDDARTV